MKKFVKETSKKFATGALAVLATIGSASLGVSADLNPETMPNHVDFTIDDTYTGNIPVYGFQTSKVFTYELNVQWGNMQFVFDRGVYNASENTLTKKVKGMPYNFCEAGVDDGQGIDMDDITDNRGVGKWCGFDGDNNWVHIENKGNGNIGLSVACTEGLSSEQSLGSTDMQIAVATADASAGTDGWTFTGTTDTTKSMRNHADTAVPMTIATQTGTAATTTIQKAFNLDGTVSTSQPDANQVEFYLNITGVPTQGNNASSLDTLDVTPSVDSELWEQLGTINLTFTPQLDA